MIRSSFPFKHLVLPLSGVALTTALRDDSACASKSHHLPMSKSGKKIVLAAGCMSGVTNDICPTFSVPVASS